MSRAAVFTHIDYRHGLEHPRAFIEFYRSRGAFFRSCLSCRNIGVVFVYSSFGVGEYIAALEKSPTAPAMPMNVLEDEQRIYNALQLVLDRAARHVAGARADSMKAAGPKFVFIGLRELASLLNLLHRMDPKLIESIAWKGKFTYDSPKYVEAIIRIARARRFTEEVVIRVDADVEVNELAVARIIEQARLCREDDQFEPYWWFSGCYSGNSDHDPVNTHAVRQHWLITPETRSNPLGFTLVPSAEHFMSDIAEIGATQEGPGVVPRLSTPAVQMMEARGHSNRRAGAQVISGAGLVASAEAIRKLPPFLNAPDLVVWVDDHLKRLLHEVIGDIGPNAPERIDACLKQDRYPSGINDRDPQKFVQYAYDYFGRLLRGCLVEAMIQTRPGEPGPLAHYVHQVASSNLLRLTDADEGVLRQKLFAAARQRFDEVMFIWKHADYGDDLLRGWASDLDDRQEYAPYPQQGKVSLQAESIIDMVVEMGVGYVRLCLQWPAHVHAFDQLSAQDAYWLFTTNVEWGSPAPEWGEERVPIVTAAPEAGVQTEVPPVGGSGASAPRLSI